VGIVCTFNAWAINRSFVNASEAVPDDLLRSHDPCTAGLQMAVPLCDGGEEE
jgi:hypothetical protein